MKAITIYFFGALTMMLAFFPMELCAHKSPVKQELIVQFAPETVVIMLAYELPAGQEVERLMVRYDLDHDGTIGPLETTRFASALLPAALQGLRFEVPGERPAAQEPEVKIKRTEEGKLAMAVLMTYSLPKLGADKTRSLHVTLEKDHHPLDTPILVQGVEGFSITKVNGKALATPQHKITQTITPEKPGIFTAHFSE